MTRRPSKGALRTNKGHEEQMFFVPFDPSCPSWLTKVKAARQLLHVAGGRSDAHRLLRLERVLDLPIQIELVLGRLRRRRRRRRFVRRNSHVPVVLEARAGGYQPPHRHVLLQPAQVVDLPGDRRFREHARRLLEARRRDERIRRQRCLGDPQQQRLRRRRTAARLNHPLVLLEEPELIRLLVDQELGVANILDPHPPHHLARDDLDVLVVDVDALQPVDLLDFVDQVLLQFLLAEHPQDVVRIARTVHQLLARTHPLALVDVDVHAARQRVLPRLGPIVRDDDHLALALDDAAFLDHAVDFRDDGRILRLARLEQLNHARQTAGDVLGLGGLARDLGQHVARFLRLAVLHHQVGVRRHVVLAHYLAVLVLDLERRLLLLIRRVDDDEAREARDFVDFLVDGDALYDVLEPDRARLLGEDRERVGIPLDDDLALLHLLAVLHLQAGAVDDRVALAIAPLLVLDDQRAAAVHDDQLAAVLVRLDDDQPLVVDGARVARVERVLLGYARRGAADVERAHRQLRARLADRLRGDDADRLAELDQPPGRQVAPVAARADAAPRGAGQHRADLHLLDAALLHRRRLVLVDLLVDLDDGIAAERVEDLFEGHAADDAVAQRLDDFARFDDGAGLDAVEGAAVVLRDDYVLRHVDQAPRQIA